LLKPFNKGDIIKAKIVLPGRLKNEMIAVAVNRCISVVNCNAEINSQVKLRIIKEKHNIFSAVVV
jgi:uncharacterized Fe-S cluster-containing radical SAM superfamily enzyme